MNKRRVVITVLTLDIALLLSGVSLTVAWYGSGSHLRVSNINIALQTPEELLIGVNDHDLVSELTENNGLYKVDHYSPVSSMYSSSWLSEQKALPEFRNGYDSATRSFPSTYTTSSKATSGFYRQELYLYSDMNVWVTLDKETLSFKEDTAKNEVKADEYVSDHPGSSKEEVLANLNSVKKSLRLSILDPNLDAYKYFIVDPYKEESTYLCGALDVNKDGYYDSYSENATQYEFVYGEYSNEDKILYNDAIDSDTSLNNEAYVI